MPDFQAITQTDYELATHYSRSWSSFAHTGSPSLAGKDTFPRWSTAYPNGKGDGKIYVAGGGKPGMQGAKLDLLNERCGFLNSEAVIKQLKY
jgi:hypothetical protein